MFSALKRSRSRSRSALWISRALVAMGGCGAAIAVVMEELARGRAPIIYIADSATAGILNLLVGFAFFDALWPRGGKARGVASGDAGHMSRFWWVGERWTSIGGLLLGGLLVLRWAGHLPADVWTCGVVAAGVAALLVASEALGGFLERQSPPLQRGSRALCVLWVVVALALWVLAAWRRGLLPGAWDVVLPQLWVAGPWQYVPPTEWALGLLEAAGSHASALPYLLLAVAFLGGAVLLSTGSRAERRTA